MDWDKYKKAPAKVIGMTLQEATGYLSVISPYWYVAKQDGKHTGPVAAIVQIALNVENDIVVGSELDGKSFGTW